MKNLHLLFSPWVSDEEVQMVNVSSVAKTLKVGQNSVFVANVKFVNHMSILYNVKVYGLLTLMCHCNLRLTSFVDHCHEEDI